MIRTPWLLTEPVVKSDAPILAATALTGNLPTRSTLAFDKIRLLVDANIILFVVQTRRIIYEYVWLLTFLRLFLQAE